MKEILIPAAAIFTVFGLPICAMLAAIVAAMMEKPRWTLAERSNIKQSVHRFADDLITNSRRVCQFMERSEKKHVTVQACDLSSCQTP